MTNVIYFSPQEKEQLRDCSSYPIIYKYIFTAWQDQFTVYEVAPVAYGEACIHLTDEKLKHIWLFHSDLDNYSPILQQGWLPSAIDTWEEWSNCILYSSVEEAECGLAEFKER